jgi:hypothetical protein
MSRRLNMDYSTTNNLENRRTELLSELSSIKSELAKRAREDALKKVADSTFAIIAAKSMLSFTYNRHQESIELMNKCAKELEQARAEVRRTIKEEAKAVKSLRKLGSNRIEVSPSYPSLNVDPFAIPSSACDGEGC